MAKLVIALEGGDGIGKSSILRVLRTYFLLNGWRVKSTHFPDYELPTGKKLRSFLNGEFGDPIQRDPWEVSDWYYENRKEFYTCHKGWFRTADVILLDRSHVSNLFFQGVKFFDKDLIQPDEKALCEVTDYVWNQNEREQEVIEYTQGALDHTLVIPLYLTSGLDTEGYPLTYLKTHGSLRPSMDLHDTNREYQRRIYELSHLIYQENRKRILEGPYQKNFPILPPLYDYRIVDLPFYNVGPNDRTSMVIDAILEEIVLRRDHTREGVHALPKQDLDHPTRIDQVRIGGKRLQTAATTFYIGDSPLHTTTQYPK